MRFELPEPAIHLGVAALCGLAVGVEREWSARQHKDPPEFAGVRTFLLFALLGGLGGELYSEGWNGLSLLLLGAGAGLVVASYVATASRERPGATTEVAALLVLAAGALAGTGRLALASALAAVVALVLVEKSRIHELVHGLRSQEIEAGVRFLVLAAVILPLLPEGPFGPPPGIRPRELWILVLLFAGLSFAGYIGLRVAGPERGYTFSGLFGGLVSSTAVTLSFARQSREQPALAGPLAAGTLAACTVLFLRVAALCAILRAELAWKALAFFALPAVAGAAAVFVLKGRGKTAKVEAELPKRPLGLRAALQMALGFQLVIYALAWVKARFEQSALIGTAALLGLTDMDALTFSMARGADTPAGDAARALTVGVLANTLLKTGIAVAVGAPAYKRRAGLALGGLALVVAASLWLLWRRIN